MGRLSSDHILKIEDYIREQGISFSPLREELLDHLLSDIEYRMDNGSAFEDAWHQVTGQIAKNHLKQIESETMESLNKKLNLNTVFAGIAILLLALSTFFKAMHWPGAGMLLLGFIGLTSFLLIISLVRNYISYRDERGRFFLGAITIGLSGFLIYLGFKILHLPGANMIGLLSVIILAITLPAVSLYFYKSRGGLGEYALLNVLHRNSMLLERVALAMIAFGIVFNLSSWMLGETQFIGVVFFLMTMIWIGIYAYSQSWRQYVEHPETRKNILLLVLSTISLLLFLFPVVSDILFGGSVSLRYLSVPMRNLAVFISPVIYIGILMYHYRNHAKTQLVMSCVLFIVYFFIRLSANMDWFLTADELVNSVAFNIAWLLFLLGLYFAFRKETYYRVLVIFMIAAHMIPNF